MTSLPSKYMRIRKQKRNWAMPSKTAKRKIGKTISARWTTTYGEWATKLLPKEWEGGTYQV